MTQNSGSNKKCPLELKDEKRYSRRTIINWDDILDEMLKICRYERDIKKDYTDDFGTGLKSKSRSSGIIIEEQ